MVMLYGAKAMLVCGKSWFMGQGLRYLPAAAGDGHHFETLRVVIRETGAGNNGLAGRAA